MNEKLSNYIFFQSFLVIILLAITIEVNCDGEYGGSYPEPPAQKMKFNIGFNLPSMSISLPKLELPQISIKASVKQKKPFTLQLPVIKFNAHAATEEDDSEYPSHGASPHGYASAEPDTSAYAGVQSGGYLGPAANMGYERPPAGQYGAPEPDAGYASSSHQTPAAAAPYNGQPQEQTLNQYQSQPQQPVHSTQSYGQQSAQQQQQPAYVTNAVQTYSVQPAQYQQEPPQPSQYGFQGRAVADYRASTSANGYYVPKPTTSNNQNQQARPAIQYQQQQPPIQLHQLQNQQLQSQQLQSHQLQNHQLQVQQAPVRRPVVDENVRYYEAAQVYQRPNMQMNQQPSQAGNYEIITAPEFAKLYGSRLHSNFARRTTFQTVPDYETVWYAAPSNENPSVVPAPSMTGSSMAGSSMAGSSMAGWTPILL